MTKHRESSAMTSELVLGPTYAVERAKQMATPMNHVLQTTTSSRVATSYRGGISVVNTHRGMAKKMTAPIMCEYMLTAK